MDFIKSNTLIELCSGGDQLLANKTADNLFLNFHHFHKLNPVTYNLIKRELNDKNYHHFNTL